MEKDRKHSKQTGFAPSDSKPPFSSGEGLSGTIAGDPSSELEGLPSRAGMRRANPNNDAMAAALEMVQRLAAEVDAEDTADDIAEETMRDVTLRLCRVCGYRNREGHKFCGMCGLPVDSADDSRDQNATPAEREPRSRTTASHSAAAETHHYHHHYHHYFPAGQESAGPSPRATIDAGREADKLRASAALRGESMSRAEAAVRRVTQEWVLACNTKNLDDLLDLYIADALVLRSNLAPVRGAAAVRELFFGALDSGLGEVEVEPIRVDVVGDMAYEAGRCKALVPGAAGKRREERGKYVWVLTRQSTGEWKIAADCWSSDLTLIGLESDIAPVPGAKAAPPRKTV